MLFKYWTGRWATAPAKNPFRLDGRDRCGVDGRQVRIDDARLRMRSRAQSLAEQPLGSVGITVGRQQKINAGSRRIDRSIQITPTAFHLDVGLIAAP
jgi:hypothetical protein